MLWNFWFSPPMQVTNTNGLIESNTLLELRITAPINYRKTNRLEAVTYADFRRGACGDFLA
jgi:hypothetical protein